ncbi:MAG: hypothetical protein HXX09_16810 [Bacteroidetes bacterium]|nr:hypothetical protein [Bacteroidota bacterium]
MDNDLKSISRFQIYIIGIIVKAFRELSERDSSKYYNVDEFCSNLNSRAFKEVEFEQIKTLIPIIASAHLGISENYEKTGLYYYTGIGSKGLIND